MNSKQIEQHVPILGVIHLVAGAVFVVIGVFVYVLLTGIGAAVAIEDPIAPQILGTIGTAVGTLLVVLGLPGIVAGYGLQRQLPWARGLAIAIGILNLVNLPLGTLIGVYTLLVLMPTEAADYFASLKPT